jgi:hypothetical protein
MERYRVVNDDRHIDLVTDVVVGAGDEYRAVDVQASHDFMEPPLGV